MKWYLLFTLALTAGCSTFGDPPEFSGSSDTGLSDAAAPVDAGSADMAVDLDTSVAPDASGTEDASDTDMGIPFDPRPVAEDTPCAAIRRHVSIDTTESGLFDDNISMAANHLWNSLEVHWIERDGTRRGTSISVQDQMGVVVQDNGEIGPTANMASANAFAYAGIDVAATSGDDTALAYAGHNCASDDLDSNIAIWFDGDVVASQRAGNCTSADVDREFPNAWLPAIVGGYNLADSSQRDPVVAYFTNGGYASFAPASSNGEAVDFESRPGWREWTRGTTGDLVMFPSFGLLDIFVWNPRTPARAPLHLPTPGVPTNEIIAGRSRIDLVHYREDRYFLAFSTEDNIYMYELAYDSTTHDVSAVRVIDIVPIDSGSGPSAEAVRLAVHPEGLVLFYLDAATDAGTGREHWTIQPYRLGITDVLRLECPYVFADFVDLDVHDVELDILRSNPADLIVLAAVHYSIAGGGETRTINVEGASFTGLP